jgi:hypothetical protein
VTTIKNTSARLTRFAAAFALAALSANSNATAQVSLPPMNPSLAQSQNNQAHWNSAQTDSTEIAVAHGSYELTPESVQYLANESTGIPHFTDKVAGTTVQWWWSGFALRKYKQENGKLIEIARSELPITLPNYTQVSDEERLKQSQEVQRLLDAKDEQGLLGYMKAQPNRMLTSTSDQVLSGAIYSLITRDDSFIGASGRRIFRIEQLDPKDPNSGMSAPMIRDMPVELYDNEKVKRGTHFGADLNLGMGMTFNGFLVLNTVGGKIITLDPKTLKVIDTFAVKGDDEMFLNGIATSEEADNGAVYVASNHTMYRLVVDASGKIHDDEASGAWAAAYDRGIRLNAVKIADGTGATPTLQGFGPNDDKLVVITDGAQKMRLVAFWRDQIPAGWKQKPGTQSPRIADQQVVNMGPGVETVQSEQSVASYGNYAFVVNNIIDKDAPYLDKNNTYVTMLNGATRPGPRGAAMFNWDNQTHAWKQLWTRTDVSPISIVPMISGGGRMAIIDGYFADKWNDRYQIGMDLDSGKTVLKIHTGSDPRFNGMYAAIKVDEQGAIMYGMAFGLVRLDISKMKKVE